MNKKILRDNGLSICLFLLFAISLAGQAISGFFAHNEEQREHRQTPAVFSEYLASGHFLEAVFENWESEFLQMALYVLLTVFLFQRGSAESKDPDGGEKVDEDPNQHKSYPHAPWPVKQGGVILMLYNHSLTIVLFLLFIMSFLLHGFFGLEHYNDELLLHHEIPVTLGQYMTSSQFWYESFQNWQSEFLSIAMVVVLSVYLRQIGSPESKPVFYPHSKTGKE